MSIAHCGRVVVLAVVVCASACGGNKAAPTPATSPTSPAPPTPPTVFSLSGKIVAVGTAAAVVGATVSIGDGPDAGLTRTTDSSGQYSFTGLQSFTVTINVSAANYVPQAQRVALTSNRTLDFVLHFQPVGITLTGRVTDAATGGPIAGAIVYINGRYHAPTDTSGQFSVSGVLDYGYDDYTYVFADNYFPDFRYIRGTTQDVRLRRFDRIAAGESRIVTVAPDDSLCVNNMQDTPGLGPDYVCRSLLVTVPQDGAVTIEAVSAADGWHPQLEVETRGAPQCCSERLGNPTTIQVTAGVEIIVNVEMLANSTSPQSFVVQTSPPR